MYVFLFDLLFFIILLYKKYIYLHFEILKFNHFNVFVIINLNTFLSS